MHPLGGHVALRNLNLSPFADHGGTEVCPSLLSVTTFQGKKPFSKAIQVWEELHSVTCYFQR